MAQTVAIFERLRVKLSRVRAIDSCQQRSLIYNFGPHRQSNCQTQRQFEPQTPNGKELRTSTRYKIFARIEAIICP